MAIKVQGARVLKGPDRAMKVGVCVGAVLSAHAGTAVNKAKAVSNANLRKASRSVFMR